MKSVQEIVELASAYYGSAVLFAAIDNGVFAAVAEGASLADVVAKTGGNERGMRLLLDACVAEGLLTKQGETYVNTPASKMALIPGGPADLTKAIRYNRDVYPAWVLPREAPAPFPGTWRPGKKWKWYLPNSSNRNSRLYRATDPLTSGLYIRSQGTFLFFSG